jgi:ComF family protein
MWQPSIKAIGNLFLQRACPLCDRSTADIICSACWQQLERQTHNRPMPPRAEHLPVIAWGIYQDPLKQAIAALKYSDHPQIAVPLGRALGQLWQRSPLPTRRSPVVIPIPMHHDKQRLRGFNQAELLAQAFCTQTGLKLAAQGLQRQRATVPQFGLGPTERQANVAGAFAVEPGLSDRLSAHPALLLDDIYTTGTTVAAAAQVLRRHRISVCGVVVIAQAMMEQTTIRRNDNDYC